MDTTLKMDKKCGVRRGLSFGNVSENGDVFFEKVVSLRTERGSRERRIQSLRLELV